MSFNLKVIFLLTFVWGSLASYELGFPIYHIDCPRFDDINNVVMLPYDQDCGKYYSCLNGHAYLQHCPYNLQWSVTTNRCDRPEVAQCQLAIAKIPVAPIPVAPISVAPIPVTPIEVISTFPTGYPYTPNNPIPIAPTFPTGYPYTPNNPIPFTPTFQTGYPYIPTNTDVIYQRHPNDCSIYYQCQALQCPSYLYWNSYTQQCDYPQNVQCSFGLGDSVSK